MADFPPNLDDGELWLPSDILPDEIFPKFSSDLKLMEEPIHQPSSYSLFEQKQINSKPPPNLAPNFKIRPPNQFCSMVPPQPKLGLGFCENTPVGHNFFVSRNGGGSYFESRPYQFHDMKPPQPQLGNFLQARTITLQRQQNLQNHVQNHLLPFQVNGSCNSGFIRGYGGTGVFIPRISATTTNPRKKQSVNKVEESIKRKGGPVKKVVGV